VKYRSKYIKRKDGKLKTYFKYEKGSRMLENELDIVSLIKAMRRIKLIS